MLVALARPEAARRIVELQKEIEALTLFLARAPALFAILASGRGFRGRRRRAPATS